MFQKKYEKTYEVERSKHIQTYVYKTCTQNNTITMCHTNQDEPQMSLIHAM